MEIQSEATPLAQTQTPTSGGLWRRLVANLIDLLIASVIQFPLNIIETLFAGAEQSAFFAQMFSGQGLDLRAPAFLIFIFFFTLKMAVSYFFIGWFYKNKGGTPGKLVMNLKVLDSETGAHLGYNRAFFRETIGKTISILPLGLGILIGAFRKDRKTLHDLLFNTQVLKMNSRR